MLGMEWELGLLVVGSAVVAAVCGQWVVQRFTPVRELSWSSLEQMGERTVFLFEQERLVDATPEARALLRCGPARLGEWRRMIALLEPRFPGFRFALDTLSDDQTFRLTAEDGIAEVEAEWLGGLTRIALTDRPEDGAVGTMDEFGLRALTTEVESLRSVLDGAPMLVWKVDADDTVSWANAAYLELAQRQAPEGTAVGWPLPRVFDARAETAILSGDQPARISLTLPDARNALWFDAFVEAKGREQVVYALPAGQLVRTEASLSEFVQTLSKTFAHLTTGLAVFDRDRRLALFNPALTDLFALDPTFLTARPTLFQFLDVLREKQRMPEPKDYKSWRRQIGELETAAASGPHVETWTLPGGQTYRVTGRPHPEGAVAFLFEDITAEISATRLYRSELELGQSVLDSLDEAIVVFSAAGFVILTNGAYDSMWGEEPSTTVSDIGVNDAVRSWVAQTRPTPAWLELQERLARVAPRGPWSRQVERLDGRRLLVRSCPVAGNAMLVGFRAVPARASAPPMPMQAHETGPAPAE